MMEKDDIYVEALYKTLTKVDSPITVGLYSPCHRRLKKILSSIKGYMDEEAQRKPQNSKCSIRSLILLIFRLLFYRPVWTDKKQNWDCTRYEFVKFSAWHFTGSDMLWAGLVMQLCRSLENRFGRLQLSLFRVAQYDPKKDMKKKITKASLNDWRSKKLCCCPFWALVLVFSLIAVLSIIIIAFTRSSLIIDVFAYILLGVPSAGVIGFNFSLVKSLIFNQDAKLRRALNNNKVSEQLGLMHEIRKEIRLLSCFIHFMEHFNKRRIRVVLEITNLDRCTPPKIVGVLEAINIFLSDEESPFILLVAGDPEVLAQKVDQVNCFDEKDQMHGFLDRTIILPFTLPPMCNESKCKVFQNIIEGRSVMFTESQTEILDLPYEDTSSNVEHHLLIESSLHEDALKSSTSYAMNRFEGLINRKAFKKILSDNKNKLQTYISENTVSMRRVINSVTVSTILGKIDLHKAEHVIAWIILVDRWPCRLSWILQCAEDEHQTMENSDCADDFDYNKTLWSVFTENRFELHTIRKKVEKFLEKDDDPELFERFLNKDYKFTVREAFNFMKYTVNLDYSIRNKFARIRQSNSVKETGRKGLKKTCFTMTVGDVCNEMSSLGLSEKYIDAVKKNQLNGQALFLADPADLKEAMQMNIGDWTLFKKHFPEVMSVYQMNEPMFFDPTII